MNKDIQTLVDVRLEEIADLPRHQAQVQPLLGGVQVEVRFHNGYGLSIIRHQGAYCSMRTGAPLAVDEPDFEIALIQSRRAGAEWPLVGTDDEYANPEALALVNSWSGGGVQGWVSQADVLDTLRAVARF